MTAEMAVYVLRRKVQDDAEARCHVAALKALGREGRPLWEIEGDIMRSLTPEEAAVIEKEASRG